MEADRLSWTDTFVLLIHCTTAVPPRFLSHFLITTFCCMCTITIFTNMPFALKSPLVWEIKRYKKSSIRMLVKLASCSVLCRILTGTFLKVSADDTVFLIEGSYSFWQTSVRQSFMYVFEHGGDGCSQFCHKCI